MFSKPCNHRFYQISNPILFYFKGKRHIRHWQLDVGIQRYREATALCRVEQDQLETCCKLSWQLGPSTRPNWRDREQQRCEMVARSRFRLCFWLQDRERLFRYDAIHFSEISRAVADLLRALHELLVVNTYWILHILGLCSGAEPTTNRNSWWLVVHLNAQYRGT